MLVTYLTTLFAAPTVNAAWTSPIDPRTIPTCIRTCAIKATQASGCLSPLDLACVCPGGKGYNTYFSTAANCIAGCGGTAFSDAISINNILCAQPLGSGLACPTVAEGWSVCDGICVDLSLQSCASGAIVNPTIPRRSLVICEPHERMCQVGQLFGSQHDQAGYECLDINSNLEACGGSLKGRCRIMECEEGLTLINGRCK